MSQPITDPTIDPAPTGTPETGATPPVPPAPPSSPSPETGDRDTTDWKAEAERWKEQARKNEERSKANLAAKAQAAAEARQQIVRDLAKTLGLDDGEPLDPKQLTEALKQSQAAAQEAEIDAIAAQIERDVIRIAYRVGADPERLLDSRAFCDEIDDIEADDMADFAKQVEAKIKTHLEKHPGLRATGQAPARQGADISGGGAGGQRRERPTSLSAAIKSAYGQK